MTSQVKTKPIAPSARTVTVACKVPMGLRLQCQEEMKTYEDSQRDGGPKPKTYNVFRGPVYYVHGPSYPVGTIPKGFPRQPQIEGGYALTPGIPVDFWEKWLKQNEKSDFVVPPPGAEHGMIFAYAEHESAADAAREQEKLLSGLEPISTDEDATGKLTDRRLPKPINQMVAKVASEPHPAG
jgi:hypothetical protein